MGIFDKKEGPKPEPKEESSPKVEAKAPNKKKGVPLVQCLEDVPKNRKFNSYSVRYVFGPRSFTFDREHDGFKYTCAVRCKYALASMLREGKVLPEPHPKEVADQPNPFPKGMFKVVGTLYEDGSFEKGK